MQETTILQTSFSDSEDYSLFFSLYEKERRRMRILLYTSPRVIAKNQRRISSDGPKSIHYGRKAGVIHLEKFLQVMRPHLLCTLAIFTLNIIVVMSHKSTFKI